ncbi:MAG TPA: hypothetical protein VFQ53_19270 [Kofleriaceae bacterium]|nr:hypothetical protein [Kofleriaceae bacterium]
MKWLVGLVLAAGCWRGAATQSDAIASAPTGCPPATGVRLVRWSGGPDDAEGEVTWRMVMSIKHTDIEDPMPPQPYPLQRIRNVPKQVVLYRHGAEGDFLPPCRAKVREGYRGIGGYGEHYEEIGVILDGCPDGAPESIAWALDAPAPPTRCELVAAHEEPEAKAPELAAFAPQPFGNDPRRRPAKYKREAALRVARWKTEPVAYQLVTTFIEEPVPIDECEVRSDDHQDLLLASKAGPVRVTQPHTTGDLHAVMVEDGAPRAVMLLAIGNYLIVPVDATGKPQKTIERTVSIPHEEDTYRFSLAPYCGP